MRGMSVTLKARLTGRYWRRRHKLENKAKDFLAWVWGFCNDCPWRAEPGSGYSFWRCGRDSGHDGLHRSRNYVWGADGRPEYVPVDNAAATKLTDAPYADQPWSRSPTLSRRQQRAADAWHVAAVDRRKLEQVSAHG